MPALKLYLKRKYPKIKKKNKVINICFFHTVLFPRNPSCSLFTFQSCQADLVKDNGHKYFLAVLSDPYMPVRFTPGKGFMLN